MVVFVRNLIKFEKVDMVEFISDTDLELSCIELKEYGVIVVSLYRPPNDQFKFFSTI